MMSANTAPAATPVRRRLVICCDGTWNSPDKGAAATNVVRMARIIKSQSSTGIPQIVFYHSGVGTGNWFDRIGGGASGIGVSRAVREVYAFLVNNYIPPEGNESPGDEIFLFGFSRGAYTARAVAGLIGTIGILRPPDMGGFMEAWGWYRLPPDRRDITALDARFPTRLKDVPVRCVGVWDTVGALGVPANRFLPHWHPCADTYRFFDTKLGPHVQYAFQALAIDEKRAPFVPVPWNDAHPAEPDQVIRQTWFCGVHSDVGGGYPDHGAADIPFLWMAAQVNPLLDLDILAIPGESDTTQVYGGGTLHDSYTVSFRLAGALNRTIGPEVGQYVHRSVIDRLAKGGYAINPAFRYQTLPVWQPDSFEQSYAWSQAALPPKPPALPQRKRSCCDRLVSLLGGG